jgi:hypothetical protein
LLPKQWPFNTAATVGLEKKERLGSDTMKILVIGVPSLVIAPNFQLSLRAASKSQAVANL